MAFNTIVNPKTDGIRFSSTESIDNMFFNNIIVGPGSINAYSPFSRETPFINIGGKVGISAIISNNYFHSNMSEVQFIDTTSYNFRLKAESPCIDAGMDLTNLGVTSDFDGNLRPSGYSFDIGAFEFQSEHSKTEYEKYKLQSETDKTFSIYPNPTNGVFHINSESPGKENLIIRNKDGAIVYQNNNFSDWNTPISLGRNQKSGFYLVALSRNDVTSVRVLIIE